MNDAEEDFERVVADVHDVENGPAAFALLIRRAATEP
jgi:hypothetical protein